MPNVHRNHKGWVELEEGCMEVGGEGDIHLSLHCHNRNDSSIKMGSDESHFNV